MASAGERYELAAGFSFIDRIRAPYKLAYVADMKVKVHDLDSGRRRTIFDERLHHVACPLAWSPDGSTVFHSHDQLVAIGVGSRKARALTSFRGDDRFRIMWNLECSPDGRTLLFLHHSTKDGAPRWCIYSVRADGSELHRVGELASVWSFCSSWEKDLLLVTTALGENALLRMDLRGANARVLSKGTSMQQVQLTPDARHAVYESDRTIWRLSTEGGDVPEFIAHGSVPALSPDGNSVAFMRDEHDVYIQRLAGGPPELVLRARPHEIHTEPRGSSYQTPPRWSPDGRLLCVWSTIARRFDEPLNPRFVASLRRRQAGERRRLARDGRVSTKPAMNYEASIEHAHWKFDHSVGIVDFEGRKVWLTPGYWQNAAWAPVRA